MRKGSKMRIPNSLLNIYLILALIGLIVGLFIYNYFKLREGLVDENAIRNYISYISFKDALPKIPKTINIDNKDYSTYYLFHTRDTLYSFLSDFSGGDVSNNLNNTLKIANDKINNITKSNYYDCLTYQSTLDNAFLDYLINNLSINTTEKFFEFIEKNKDHKKINKLKENKNILEHLKPYLSILFQSSQNSNDLKIFNNLNHI